MRRALPLLATLLLLGAGGARAQFANNSIGLSVGYMGLNGTNTGINGGIPVALTASHYLDGGFDLVFELGVMVLHVPQLQPPNILGVEVAPLGFRYLFLEEDFRPYVGLDMSYLHIFGDAYSPSVTADWVGVGPNVGFEYFVSESLSVGVKAKFNLYVALNDFGTSWNVNGHVAAYF